MVKSKEITEHLSQAEKVKAITEQLESGIQALFESEQFKNYLKTLSKFHSYSVNNTILIAMQNPDATLVAGYTSWQHDFGRSVRKGEKGIRILAPAPFKKKTEVDRLDPVTGKAVLNADGSVAKDVQEVTIPAFKVVNVFDVSQTEGRELPSIGVDELTGDVAQYENFLKALEDTCPVPVAFEQITSGAKGYFNPMEQRIALQEGMSQAQTIKTLIHEMAHQKLHSADEMLSRNTKEVEAEAVAYTIAQHYGIDTTDYSFAYIAGWSMGKGTAELKASLDRIRNAADEMITGIDEQFQSLEKAKIQMIAERKTDVRPSVLKTLRETKTQTITRSENKRMEVTERI